MQDKIAPLLNKPMSRKQFLTVLGLGFLSLIGFSTIIELLGGTKHSNMLAKLGFGAGPYGGYGASAKLTKNSRY